jgi:hypothetical protein
MRWLPFCLFLLAFAGPARADDIIDVLRRSQDQRLETLGPARDPARARSVAASFDALRAAVRPSTAFDFHVVSGNVTAETLHGHIIVANESLADRPEGERLFILARELGHVACRHWLQMALNFKRWVPGEVSALRPVSTAVERDAADLAHRQQVEADAYALRVLAAMGYTDRDTGIAPDMLGSVHTALLEPAGPQRVSARQGAVAAGECTADPGPGR